MRMEKLKKLKMPLKPMAAKDAEIDLDNMPIEEPEMDHESDAPEGSPEEEANESPEEMMLELETVPDDVLIKEMKKRKLKV